LTTHAVETWLVGNALQRPSDLAVLFSV